MRVAALRASMGVRTRHSAAGAFCEWSVFARAAAEQIIRQRQAGKAPRILLNLATGAGKTRIAAALLRKLADAGLVHKALFLCDRTELRENGLGDFQGAFGNDAAEVSTEAHQKNAKVLIATYQTFDHKDAKGAQAFFEANYPPGFFDVIVIDECHRSAWSDWFRFLKVNAQAIHIGLTATPRQLAWPEPKNEEEAKAFAEDQRRVPASWINRLRAPDFACFVRTANSMPDICSRSCSRRTSSETSPIS